MMEERTRKLKDFQEKIHYSFQNLGFLEQALIHKSYINEHSLDAIDSNERLEFLGDAVLELVVSDILFRHYPKQLEGSLTKKRSQLVCEPSLAFLAHKLGLSPYVLLSRGEELSGGRKKDSILSDCFEALCAAIYLDGGYQWIYELFDQNFEDILAQEFMEEKIFIDYKSKLQEYCHRKNLDFSYVLEKEEGLPHDKTFTMALYINQKIIARGCASNKKQAQQEAAKHALEALDSRSRF